MAELVTHCGPPVVPAEDQSEGKVSRQQTLPRANSHFSKEGTNMRDAISENINIGLETFSEEERRKELESRTKTNTKKSSILGGEAEEQWRSGRSSTHSHMACAVLRSWRHQLAGLVLSKQFEALFCVLIFSNAIFFGVEAQYLAETRSSETPSGFKVVSTLYTAVFTVELLLRVAALGPQFCGASERAWNIFDTAIVSLSLLETIMFFFAQNSALEEAQDLSYIRMIRIVRTARIFRIIRIVSFFRSLRLLLLSVLNTLRSLMWTLLLLLIILYTFGVIFTHASLEDLAKLDSIPDLDRYWGSVPRSVYTLFKTITGGVDWEIVVKPLEDLHGLWVGFFVVYVAFTFFAVLNVVTGVFCQTAIESAAKDQEDMLQVQESAREMYVQQLTELFFDVDVDGSGELTIDEFETLLHDERLQRYCASLDITIDDAWALFKLLDTNGSAAISANEFVGGCLRLQGSARSVDIALLTYQMNWIIARFSNFAKYTDAQFQTFYEHLLTVRRADCVAGLEGIGLAGLEHRAASHGSTGSTAPGKLPGSATASLGRQEAGAAAWSPHLWHQPAADSD